MGGATAPAWGLATRGGPLASDYARRGGGRVGRSRCGAAVPRPSHRVVLSL
ncbi:hypothetical protein SAMN05216553_10991 [Lentzea fradiae]|uniref:Uncharacterized protein n=1 Tax=Lentzea fradiae TaxID=200378 RepID=A0A1G7VAE2_9PSEU|nr:hypothetical protein SAMN05216553_10991 [Lentzea fradiae]